MKKRACSCLVYHPFYSYWVFFFNVHIHSLVSEQISQYHGSNSMHLGMRTWKGRLKAKIKIGNKRDLSKTHTHNVASCAVESEKFPQTVSSVAWTWFGLQRLSAVTLTLW